MAHNKIVISSNFPYLPISVSVAKKDFESEALIDTGYSGGIVIPELTQ